VPPPFGGGGGKGGANLKGSPPKPQDTGEMPDDPGLGGM